MKTIELCWKNLKFLLFLVISIPFLLLGHPVKETIKRDGLITVQNTPIGLKILRHPHQYLKSNRLYFQPASPLTFKSSKKDTQQEILVESKAILSRPIRRKNGLLRINFDNNIF